MTRSLRIPTLLLMAALVATACGGGGGSPAAPASDGAPASGASGGPVTSGSAGTINVLSLWGGSEEEAFKAVLEAFTAKTGVGRNVRGRSADLRKRRFSRGSPAAIRPTSRSCPGIGFLRRFAKDGTAQEDRRSRRRHRRALEQQLPGGLPGHRHGRRRAVRDPGQVQQQGHDVVPARRVQDAGVTANPDDVGRVQDDARTLVDKPGAMALGAKDDWNLTDWFENIYIRQAGVEAYDKLFSAEGDWTDPSVQKDRRHDARGHQREVRRWWHRRGGRACLDGRDRPGLQAGARGCRLLRGRLRRRHRHRPDQQGPRASARPSTGSHSRRSANTDDVDDLRWRRRRGPDRHRRRQGVHRST